MKAGRELDALVAIAVFGAKHSGTSTAEWMHFPTTGPYADCDCEGHMEAQVCPRYSTNIADAWEVVEKADLWSLYGSIGDGPYRACIQFEDREGLMTADTAPLAICLAALKAKGGDA